MRFAIYGMGGFGREVAPVARDQNGGMFPALGEQTRNDVVFVDEAEGVEEKCNGYPVLNFDELLSDGHRDRQVVVAIGDGRIREKIENRCIAAGLKIGIIRAPSARILDSNEIGLGSVLCDNVIITSNIKIGKSFQGNIYSYVAHDCVIGDYVSFAPRVSCNGNIHIGDYVYVGTNASFIQGKRDKPLIIGEGAIVGMGSVVTKSVEPYTVVAGNPARPIKRLTPPT